MLTLLTMFNMGLTIVNVLLLAVFIKLYTEVLKIGHIKSIGKPEPKIPAVPQENHFPTPLVYLPPPPGVDPCSDCTTCGHQFQFGEIIDELPYCCHRHWSMWKQTNGV